MAWCCSPKEDVLGCGGVRSGLQLPFTAILSALHSSGFQFRLASFILPKENAVLDLGSPRHWKLSSPAHCFKQTILRVRLSPSPTSSEAWFLQVRLGKKECWNVPSVGHFSRQETGRKSDS